MSLPTPTGVNQLAGGGSYPHEDCGEACVRSILIDAGKAESIAQIEGWDNTHGDWPGDGTGGNVVLSKLASVGIQGRAFEGDTLSSVRDAWSRGYNRAMVAIWSDHGGAPSAGSGIGHWILVYGIDEARGVFKVMQPVGGYLTEYSIGSVEAAQQRYGIAVQIPSQPGAATPISAGSNSMWIAKKVFLMANGVDGYLLDGWGGLHPIGNMPNVKDGPYWPHTDIARDLVVKPDYSGGYVLDGNGGLHPFSCKGKAPPPSNDKTLAYWPNFDVAIEVILMDWSKPSGWTVDGWGGIHPFGGIKQLSSTAYWPGGHP